MDYIDFLSKNAAFMDKIQQSIRTSNPTFANQEFYLYQDLLLIVSDD